MALRKEAAAIAGIGQTEFSKNSGRSELQLAAEAVRAAINDAGLKPADVDGLVTMTVDPNDELALMRSVGMEEVRWTSRTPFGGGGSSALVEHAAAAVAAGRGGRGRHLPGVQRTVRYTASASPRRVRACRT